MLAPDARMQFRRLALFCGGFTLDAMCAVVCETEFSVSNAISGISELVAKSLVNVESDGPVTIYRLSESTRAYALEKLRAEGEQQEISARYARHVEASAKSRPSETPDRRSVRDDSRTDPSAEMERGVVTASAPR
jgi:predicted ATPase